MDEREIIAAVLAALIVAAAVQADMMPADAGCPRSPWVLSHPEEAGSSTASGFARRAVDDLLSRSRGMLPDAPLRIEGAAPAPRRHVLAVRQTSVGLCLCAFLSLGLCKSVPRVKRFAQGSLPRWHHAGGPYRIGHGPALAPHGLASAAVCFVVPDSGADVPLPQYRRETIISLWRRARFIPAVDAPRAPPNMSWRDCFPRGRGNDRGSEDRLAGME